MAKYKVLLFSPDPHFLADHREVWAEQQSFQWAQTLEKTTFLIREWEPHVLVVDSSAQPFDLGLISKAHGSKLGIVIVSLSGSSRDEELALRGGADLFVHGSAVEAALVWRVAALARRIVRNDKPTSTLIRVLKFGPISLESASGITSMGNQQVLLGPTQARLLEAFLSHPERLLSREMLKKVVWEGAEISPRSIDAQVSKLKKAIPALEDYLFNVYGKGYLLTQDRSKAA